MLLGFVQQWSLTLTASLLAAALAHVPAYAQTPEEAGPSPASESEPAQITRLPDDLKAFATLSL